jgi:hypothetical protein
VRLATNRLYILYSQYRDKILQPQKNQKISESEMLSVSESEMLSVSESEMLSVRNAERETFSTIVGITKTINFIAYQGS